MGSGRSGGGRGGRTGGVILEDVVEKCMIWLYEECMIICVYEKA